MRCPTCAADTMVQDTRVQPDRQWRRRVCTGPERHLYTTFEITADERARLLAAQHRLEKIKAKDRTATAAYVARLPADKLEERRAKDRARKAARQAAGLLKRKPLTAEQAHEKLMKQRARRAANPELNKRSYLRHLARSQAAETGEDLNDLYERWGVS